MPVKSFLDRMPKHKMLLKPNNYRMAHPVYSKQAVDAVENKHREPNSMTDKIAQGIVRLCYNGNNLLLGDPHKPEKLDTRNWLNRLIFLESIAGIPGMAGGMHRHLKSLRKLESDNGWIHHLLQEAENERMHLFFLLRLRSPGIFLRTLI
jgi:ubiquinol oxidase